MTRKELKENAKVQVRRQYGPHVLLNFLYLLIFGALTATFLGALLLGGPLNIGMLNMYSKSAKDEKIDIGDLFSGFNNFANVVLAFLLANIYIFLWSLLLIVPGIIKSFAYALVPYLLSKDENLNGPDAIDMSKELMKGHKWDLFVLHLSFIGWDILNVLTLGILGLLYVNPYYYQALYNFYEDVVNSASNNSEEEVEVIEPQE
ncbi:MAG: DUF975 family protein [Gammaproteobacteria bacterium]|nr:DUF975 family protein [Gammaproteobacteria bacterium]